ncbi:MAG: DoxX family protein [Myxococcota bacterium]
MSDTSSQASSSKLIWAGRVMSALPSLILAGSAAAKLTSSPEMVENFAKMGFPPGSMLTIGIVEALSLLFYLVPQTAVLGAILITGYMGGAVAIHVKQAEPIFLQVGIGVLAWGGLFLRDARLRELLPLRKLS